MGQCDDIEVDLTPRNFDVSILTSPCYDVDIVQADVTLEAVTLAGQGPPGRAATITVGSTSTTAPGSPAEVDNVGDEHDAIFNFHIPTGPSGPPGSPGTVGPAGPAGPMGPMGPSVTYKGVVASSASLPSSGNVKGDLWVTTDTGHSWGWNGAAWIDMGLWQGTQGTPGTPGTPGAPGSPGTAATIAAGTTTTGAPGSNANVTNAGSSSAAVFNFTIPRGDVGAQGAQGAQGVPGAPGPTAISTNANNKATLGSDSLLLVQGVAAGGSATTHAQTVSGDDPQLTNARTPTAHQATHVTGSDQIPSASNSTRGLLAVLSGSANDYVGGDNACHGLPIFGGLLKYVSATALSFAPFNGGHIRINGVIYAIPSAGITGLANTSVFVNGVAGQNLAANQLYKVYCFNNGGTLTADFSTTAHATSSTVGNVGTEIKSGDDTRTLIGLINTNASSQFADSPTVRTVRSWVNRKSISFSNTASSTFTSTSYASLLGVSVLCFGDEMIHMNSSGGIYNNTAGNAVYIGNFIDAAQVGVDSIAGCAAANSYYPVGSSWAQPITTEGLHPVATYGKVVGGIGTYNLALTGTVGF